MPSEPRLKAIDVSCPMCAAKSGQGCYPVAAYDWIAINGGAHMARWQDAKVASVALDALDPETTAPLSMQQMQQMQMDMQVKLYQAELSARLHLT